MGRGGKVVAAIDQGTTSTRCILFDRDGHRRGMSQMEHRQIMPRPGWVEHDAVEIWRNTRRVIADVMAEEEWSAADVAALGITNQRETTIVWDRATGEPVYNAIVWQDTRTDSMCRKLRDDIGEDRVRRITGLPVSTYFSGPKIAWILDNVEGARDRAERGELIFGTVDTWLTWNLTRRHGKALHVTDVTNASRTMLMNLETLEWDQSLCEAMGIPMSMLPAIVSSSQYLGVVRWQGPLHNVAIGGILGVPVTRPVITETTALGAAYAAGLTVGFWESTDEIRAMWREDVTFTPDMDADRRDDLFANWGKAVTRTLDWVED
ncbi:hypothetical protein WU86_03290 [Corynebacterium xerosis]|uniref:FGGY family carbohydrate kinase n=1 Tax=Corynebacterium xerosis TaxID=1725 RepID=UPI0006277404|nr:FGGY family carbohydrate kinase [Corynebacterium xerosis]KKO82441.1 hypothetical protein WU86_03290 [Corynebacterium xerosis]